MDKKEGAVTKIYTDQQEWDLNIVSITSRYSKTNIRITFKIIRE